MFIKKCIVVIVNIEYLEIFNKFLYFYSKNCTFDLIVYTVNFDYSDKNTDKIKYITYHDSNIVEFESTNTNKYIKSFSDKYKYLVALKPKIVNQSLLLDYDCFLYLDADCIITPFFNKYYSNYKDISQVYPLCPNYKEDYMVYNVCGDPFQQDGSVNMQKTLEGNLFDYFKIKQNRCAYRHSYAYIYNKKCKTFFENAFNILFNIDLFSDYNKYFPLLDETVFNFLFWSNDYKKSLGIFPFIDMFLNFKNIENFEAFTNKNGIACLHAKFYQKPFDSLLLNDFKEIDNEKYNLLEYIYKNNNYFDLFYNFYFQDEFLIFNFMFAENKTLSIIIIDDSSNILFRGGIENYAKQIFYYISIPYSKNAAIQLIFLNEKGSIIHSINEAFNN